MNQKFEKFHSSVCTTIYKLELLGEILPCNHFGCCKECDFLSLCDSVNDAVNALIDVRQELEKR